MAPTADVPDHGTSGGPQEGQGENGRRGAPDWALLPRPRFAEAELLELAILCIDLEGDFPVSGASGSALKAMGRSAQEAIGHSMLGVIHPDDRPAARIALSAMRDGVIDFYRAHRRPAAPGPSGAGWTAWVRAVEFGDARIAFVELAVDPEARLSPIEEYFGREPPLMALGVIDANWTIASVSRDITGLLGVPPEEVVGRRLVDTVEGEDLRDILEAVRGLSAEFSVARTVRLPDFAGEPRALCLVLTSRVGGEHCFILLENPVPPDGEADRIAVLEKHLWRIGAELEASGILQRLGPVPPAARHPELGRLSTRQWEVVARLVRGERVPTIATEMFLGTSTVRNHLSAIFKRFGVHSQAQLLALLRQ